MNTFMIHYKLSFEKNYKLLIIRKEAITLKELKVLLFETTFKPKHRQPTRKRQIRDFDLQVTNADTNQIFQNESDLIYKNAWLILRRIVILDPLKKLASDISTKSMMNKQSGHENSKLYSRCTVQRPPSGLPKSHYIIVDQMITTRVELMAKKCASNADHLLFDQQDSTTKISKTVIPDEYKCTLGDHIMQEAVFVPCCGRFYCCNWCLLIRVTSGDSDLGCVFSECNKEISIENIISCHDLRNKIKLYLNNKNINNRLPDLA